MLLLPLATIAVDDDIVTISIELLSTGSVVVETTRNAAISD